MKPGCIRFGEAQNGALLDLDLRGFRFPEIAEPAGLDLVDVAARLLAPPVDARFDLAVRTEELEALRDYLTAILSGNGPRKQFSFAEGLLELTFAPSRRGPVLLGVMAHNVERAHVRVEFLVTLEPRHIGAAASGLDVALR